LEHESAGSLVAGKTVVAREAMTRLLTGALPSLIAREPPATAHARDQDLLKHYVAQVQVKLDRQRTLLHLLYR
jgi:hypothetical protein